MREELDIITAYNLVGTYRGAADICGTTHRTVKNVVARHAAGDARPAKAPRPANYEGVRDVVATGDSAEGRISAERLLPTARAAGYTGSARNFRRLVAQEKKAWRAKHGRTHRPATWTPGEHLVIDWGVIAGVHVFCAVLAWSRFRFVRFAADEKAATTMGMLAECFEVLGGTPKVVLADRMGCLKGGVVANRVVPTPDYVRFATHYRFRPDFCEAADPASKGIVENLVRYGKDDLARPLLLEHAGTGDLAAGAARVLADLGAANRAAADWCAEVNAAVHSEICAARKVDKLSTIRLGSARYSVPNRLIGTHVGVLVDGTRVLILDTGTGEVHAEHPLTPPGEASVLDEHYGGPRASAPVRAIRPRSAAEKDFCALGPAAQAFIAGAAGPGHTRLGPELAELNTLTAAHGDAAMIAALERATAFGRWKASDVRSILAAGTGVPTPPAAGDALVLDLPTSTGRSLTEYAPATKAVSS
jgi:transposase